MKQEMVCQTVGYMQLLARTSKQKIEEICIEHLPQLELASSYGTELQVRRHPASPIFTTSFSSLAFDTLIDLFLPLRRSSLSQGWRMFESRTSITRSRTVPLSLSRRSWQNLLSEGVGTRELEGS